MKDTIELTKHIIHEAQELVQEHVTNADSHVLMDMALLLAVARLTVGIERCLHRLEQSVDLINWG